MDSFDPAHLLDELSCSPDLAAFRELVRPLEGYDAERRSDLTRTLSVYFETGSNASEAADRLFLHRNSLLYRLERIQSLTGLDLKDPDARLALQLGLLAARRGENVEAQHPQPATRDRHRDRQGRGRRQSDAPGRG